MRPHHHENRSGFQQVGTIADDQSPIQCNRGMVKSLLLQQWRGLTHDEIEATDYSKASLADLIERRYGIHHQLAENYLNNLERTLPLS